jgi:hypothetical protein
VRPASMNAGGNASVSNRRIERAVIGPRRLRLLFASSSMAALLIGSGGTCGANRARG